MGLADRPPPEVEAILARAGTTPKDLVCDARDEPKLAPAMALAPSFAAKLQLALEWFGDQGNPQPTERTDWHIFGRTPDWLVKRLDEVVSPSTAEPEVPEQESVRSRQLYELPPAEMAQLRRQIMSFIKSGNPSIHSMARDFHVTRRQIRNEIGRQPGGADALARARR